MDLVTICDQPNEIDMNRPVVVFTARVHPGETLASYMMRGLLRALTDNTREARELRSAYTIYVVSCAKCSLSLNTMKSVMRSVSLSRIRIKGSDAQSGRRHTRIL